jgi:TolA-binding protein
MSLTFIQKQIKQLEKKIANDQGDLAEMKRLLERLKMQEFEEDIRESDHRRLLQE